MTRQSTTLGAILLAGAVTLAWLNHAQTTARAQGVSPPPAGKFVIQDQAFATPGAATAAASDGQGSVVLSYPNGVIAIVNPAAEIAGGKGKLPVMIYRIHTDGMVEKAPFPMAPSPR